MSDAVIKKKYYWKEVTDDGLLKEPKELGPHYCTESLNGWGGFDAEEEAVERLFYISETYEFDVPANLTLITMYSVETSA